MHFSYFEIKIGWLKQKLAAAAVVVVFVPKKC